MFCVCSMLYLVSAIFSVRLRLVSVCFQFIAFILPLSCLYPQMWTISKTHKCWWYRNDFSFIYHSFALNCILYHFFLPHMKCWMCSWVADKILIPFSRMNKWSHHPYTEQMIISFSINLYVRTYVHGQIDEWRRAT